MKKVSITAAKAFIVALFAFWCQTSFAQTFEVDGLCYTISENKPLECSVTGYTGNATTVTIPIAITYEGQTYAVTCIGNGAFHKDNTSITIPKSVTSIEYGAFAGYDLTIILDEDNAYYSCVDNILYNKTQSELIACLKTGDIIVPQSVQIIAPYAFLGSGLLTSIIIPEGVTFIGNDAFQGCSGLTSIVIPDGVTSIESRTFFGCSSLTSITIPESVISIGNGAFEGCN